MTPTTRRALLRTAPAALAGVAGCSGLVPGGRRTAVDPADREGPAMFVGRGELRAVRDRVRDGYRPWTPAYVQFMADVRDALGADPESVTDNGDGHLFRTAGKDDPERRNDYLAAIRTGDRVRDLGLAYQYHGTDRYARKAVDLLDAWFLAPDTRMEPASNNVIEQFVTLPKMWWGAELVRGHEAWERDGVGRERDLASWVGSYLDELGFEVRTDFGQQNIFNWEMCTHAAGAVYRRDWDHLGRAVRRQRETGFDQLRRDGLLRNEIGRSNSLLYSLYAMKALVTLAELSRLYADRFEGPNLYEYRKFDDGSRAIERAFDAHVPYLLEPARWRAMGEGSDDRFQTTYGFPARYREEGTSAYEVAHSYYRKDAYLRAIRSRGSPVKNRPTYVDAHQWAIDHPGRPLRDERVLGWTTFSHADRFRLDPDADGAGSEGE